jgi:hypothetical protein
MELYQRLDWTRPEKSEKSHAGRQNLVLTSVTETNSNSAGRREG